MEKDRNLHSYLDEYYLLPFERQAEKYRRLAVIKELEQLQPQTLIEVGCGQDSIFHYLDHSIVGTIVEPIEKLSSGQDLGRRLPRIKVINSVFESVQSGMIEPAEVVLLSSILHEVADAPSFIETASKFLRPDGALVLVVPNAWSLHRFVGERKKIITHLEEQSDTQRKMQQHQTVFSPESLTIFLETWGFEVETLKTFFPKVSSHSQMQQFLNEKLIDDEFLETLYKLSDQLEPTGSEIIAVARKRSG